MKASKIRELSAGELEKQLAESNEQLFRLRLQLNMGQLEGLKKYRALRKDKARLMTVLTEREQAKA